MKLNHIIAALTSTLFMASCQTPHNQDSVVEAKIDSAIATAEKISPTNSEFLIQMADVRLLNLALGELAEKKSSKKAVKDFGRKMVMEQDIMIEELRSLAQMNGVTLAKELSEDKRIALEKLKKLSGRKFDRQFITLIERNHQQDAKWFREVKVNETYVNDPAIGAYAKNRLPMIDEQLTKIQKLQRRIK